VTPVAKPPVKAAAKAPSNYSVQVGAFRQKQQVDNKADLLRSKGFDCRIEDPVSAEGLYLLKVGKFKSRAEAVAMQLRLKKSGFSSFIKTN
jgi:cell division protein FtsN